MKGQQSLEVCLVRSGNMEASSELACSLARQRKLRSAPAPQILSSSKTNICVSTTASEQGVQALRANRTDVSQSLLWQLGYLQ